MALLLAATGLILKAYVAMVARGRRAALRAARRAGSAVEADVQKVTAPLRYRPVATVLLGMVGRLVMGMTSVGSGSLIIVVLLALHPALSAAGLVGTDLVQAVPLVASAAIGHLLFGDIRFDLTAALLIGCIPGVYVGARLSSRAPGGLVRRALALVLMASALKLLDVSDATTGVILATVVAVGPLLWM